MTKQYCSECGVEEGKSHEFGCTEEQCPFCGGQLVCCECIITVLDLNDEERKAFEEYVDDFVEPLKSILKRWKKSLENEGRVPFKVKK